ncbi:PREDICTED: LOW QUALITY PROTEIN, partial [Prunus dulcis]
QPYQTPPTQHEDPSIKEILSQLLKKLDRYEQEVASLKQSQSVLEKSQSKCEVRLGQIATTLNRLERTQGQFPSQTEANPRNHDQVQAITTLRSGKVIDNKIGNSEITDKEEDEVMTESRHQLDK